MDDFKPERVMRMDKLESALEELANKVVNLAVKLDEHMSEPDAHNPGVLRKKK